MSPVLAGGRAVVVAIDHPLYSWPVAELTDRRQLIERVVAAGADALIASYGTLRDCARSFGGARRIMKLDVTTTAQHGYPDSEYAVCWSVEDALRVGADAVLTFVQLGAAHELAALTAAGRAAAAADRAGLEYVCEIMPVASERFPDPVSPSAVAGAARCGAELGAHIVKTSLPQRPAGIAEAATCGVPLLIAGGDLASDRAALLASTSEVLAHGASGVAFGRNVWAGGDPEGVVSDLRALVHAGRVAPAH